MIWSDYPVILAIEEMEFKLFRFFIRHTYPEITLSDYTHHR